MKPVNFKEQNVVYAKNQPEYQSSPALKIVGAQGVSFALPIILNI